MNIGEVIKKKRKEKKISQVKLAELIGVSQTDIWRWEKDIHEPSLKFIYKLCDVLEFDLSDLISTR